jgi:hypothetical protein
MKRNNWFVPGIIIAGLVLIGLSLWAPQGQFGLNFNQKSLATVVEKNGEVTFQNNEMPAETKIEAKQKLEALDTLRTNPESDILVQFNDGGQFRLNEKSEVVLDLLDNGSPLVVIRSGEISIEKFGTSLSFWVRSEGQLYSAADYVMVDKRHARNLKDESPKNPDREQITQAEIEGVLNAKKADFFKCFGQLIQKKPQAVGQMLISFTIETQGYTSQIEISKADINDATFKSCLGEVVSRTKFRAFAGNPITTVFPLKFE